MITKINLQPVYVLGLDAKVNKNTSVKARITTGSIELGDSSKDAQANWDLAYVEHKIR